MPDLGTKHECLSCGTKFYDLGRSQLVCPSCGEDQEELAKGADEEPSDDKPSGGKAKSGSKKTKKKDEASTEPAEESPPEE